MKRQILTSIALVALIGTWTASPAAADTACETETLHSTCTSVLDVGGGPGSSGGTTSSGTAPSCQRSDGTPLACTTNEGTWSNTHQCYVSKLTPQPPPTDPIWAGRTGGTIYNCWANWRTTMPLWYPDTTTPNPEQLAHQALAQMHLTAPTIGMIPLPTDTHPTSIGTVGRPAWMWINNPTPTTYGPNTITITQGPHTLTATATVTKTTWNTGDGNTTTCTTPGTPWTTEKAHNNTKSPDCGHTYTKQGHYTITATTHWTLTWQGLGKTGTINFTLTQTTHNTIGEIHVLNLNPNKRK